MNFYKFFRHIILLKRQNNHSINFYGVFYHYKKEIFRVSLSCLFLRDILLAYDNDKLTRLFYSQPLQWFRR